MSVAFKPPPLRSKFKKDSRHIVRTWLGFFIVTHVEDEYSVPYKALVWVVPSNKRGNPPVRKLIDEPRGATPRIRIHQVIPLTKVTCDDAVSYSTEHHP